MHLNLAPLLKIFLLSLTKKNLMTISSLFTAKNSINHRHALAKKLTHRDFPKGAYLLITPHKKVYDNSINEDDSEDMANDILTEDMQGYRNHKNRHSFRFRRNTDSFNIEHCCTKANIDVCGRYFCH